MYISIYLQCIVLPLSSIETKSVNKMMVDMSIKRLFSARSILGNTPDFNLLGLTLSIYKIKE